MLSKVCKHLTPEPRKPNRRVLINTQEVVGANIEGVVVMVMNEVQGRPVVGEKA